MPLESVIARIKGQVPALLDVGGAADLDAANEGVKRFPSAFVIPLADTAGPNGLVGAVSQEVGIRFGVVLALRNVRDAGGQNSLIELKAIRSAIRAALLGWSPGSEFDPSVYRAGRLMGLKNAILWWQEEYATATLIRSV